MAVGEAQQTPKQMVSTAEVNPGDPTPGGRRFRCRAGGSHAASFLVAVVVLFGSGGTSAARAAPTGWRAQSAPSFAGDLSGISCPSGGVCIAVGSRSTSARTVPVAEVWHGGRWRFDQVKLPPGGGSAALLD